MENTNVFTRTNNFTIPSMNNFTSPYSTIESMIDYKNENLIKYYNGIFDTMVLEYDNEQEESHRIFLETGMPGSMPKLSYSINTTEFADALNELNLTNISFVLVSVKTIVDVQIFLVHRNNKYYTIALISGKPGTICQYYH